MDNPLIGVIEPRRSTRREAQARVKKIRGMVVGVHEELALAYRLADHVALGYANTDAGWKAYVGTEYQDQLPQIDAGERKQLALMFAAIGMSQRKIAASIGTGRDQVSDALRSSNGPAGTKSPDTETLRADDSRWMAGDKPDELPLTTAPPPPKPAPATLTLRTHTGEPVPYPKPQGKSVFNATPGEGISWASWSWNPVTGCLHGCNYCYARELANSERLRAAYPVGFTPLFHPERLDAPANTTIPAQHRDDPAWRRVFVCSMADLYGRWVPDEWVQAVHASMCDNPQWQYITLTKFPTRYIGLDMPPGAWVGTSVDEQKRVRIAEDSFRKIDNVAVKWLSLEPLREPLEFTDLSMFDWVVIGAQTETRQPDGVVSAFAPPFDWVQRIYAQAREAGCKVHMKPNLLGRTSSQSPGMNLPDEYPAVPA